jgi:hypothetical protein
MATLGGGELKAIQDALTRAKLQVDAATEAVMGGGGMASAAAIARLQRLAESGNCGCGCGNCGCACGEAERLSGAQQ